MTLHDVDQRARRLLKMLVETYIAGGEPVPSKLLASQPGVNVSPATVRNVMADLEARGLVISPHTSAGKIPTQAGLRFFVDSLVSVQPLEAASVALLRRELSSDFSPKELVANASRLLSQVTRMAGLVTLPRREIRSLRQVEFLPLPGRRVLVILVVNEREVHNRVIHTEREYQDAELTQAANFINREFVGQSLASIRAALLESMQTDKDHLDRLLQTALDVAAKAFPEEPETGHDFVLAGETHLLGLAAQNDPASMRMLFEAFERKRDVLHLLDRCLASDGVQLFIGEEAGHDAFGDLSLVTASYQVDGQIAGVLGVIGPTRMAYQRVIPIVDLTARLLTEALESS